MVAAFAVSLAGSLAGCGKAKAPSVDAAQHPEASSLPQIGEVTGLPAETRVVMEAQVAPLEASPVVRHIFAKVLGRDPEAQARLEALLVRCHIDVARDIDRLTVAMSEPTDVALIVRGRLDERALLECIRAEAGALEESQRGGRAVFATTGDTTRVWLTFPAAGTVLAASSVRWLDAIVDARSAKITSRADTMALLGNVDRRAALWGVGTLPPGVGSHLGQLTGGTVKEPARAVSFTVDAGRQAPLAAVLWLEMSDQGDAHALATFSKGQLDLLAIAAQRYGLGRMVARTQITAERSGVKLALRIDEGDLRLIEGALGQATEKSDTADTKKEQVR